MAASMPVTVEGHVGRGFEAVREAFAGKFARRRELGGACCAYHRGEKVVDLWGGIRNKQTGEPWEFFHEEIALPLGLDLSSRLPDAVPNSRLATLAQPA